MMFDFFPLFRNVVLAILELATLLPEPPEYWDSNYVPPEPVSDGSYYCLFSAFPKICFKLNKSILQTGS